MPSDFKIRPKFTQIFSKCINAVFISLTEYEVRFVYGMLVNAALEDDVDFSNTLGLAQPQLHGCVCDFDACLDQLEVRIFTILFAVVYSAQKDPEYFHKSINQK